MVLLWWCFSGGVVSSLGVVFLCLRFCGVGRVFVVVW